MFGLYLKRQTDSTSFLFATVQLARLAAPLAYNFLLIEKYRSDQGVFLERNQQTSKQQTEDWGSTAYEYIFGSIDTVPIIGNQVPYILPTFILLFSFLNLTNFYSKLMNCLGLGSFTFGTGIPDPNKLIEGKSLIARERTKKQRELQILQNF